MNWSVFTCDRLIMDYITDISRNINLATSKYTHNP